MHRLAKTGWLVLAGCLVAAGSGADQTGELVRAEEPLLAEDLGCLDPGRDPVKATLADMRNLGTAFLAWVYDQTVPVPDTEEAKRLSAEAVALQKELGREPEGVSTWLRWPHETLTRERLEAILIPREDVYYMREIPTLDGWCRPLEIVGSPDNPYGPYVLGIRSAGANGEFEGPRYEIGAFRAGDEVDDIVWADGFFVRWPATKGTEGAE